MATTEDRVAALEQQVAALTERLDMESGLAASRDRDISEIKVVQKSHTTMIQALQEGQTSLREDVTGLREEVRTGFGEMRSKFQTVEQGQQAILGLLNQLIEGDD